MSMSLTYDGTALALSGANTPDADIAVGLVQVGGIRRTYLGAAVGWQRWRKHTVGLDWSGVSSDVVSALQPLGAHTGIVYGTGFDAAMFGTGFVNFRVVPDSWSATLTGLNAYDVGLRLEEV